LFWAQAQATSPDSVAQGAAVNPDDEALDEDSGGSNDETDEAQDVASDEDGAEVDAQRGRRREALERQRQRSAVFASRRANGFLSDASLDHDSESDSDSEAVVLVPAAAQAAQASSRPAYPVKISFRAGLVQNHDSRGYSSHKAVVATTTLADHVGSQAGFPRTMGAVLLQAGLGTLNISVGSPTLRAFFLLCV